MARKSKRMALYEAIQQGQAKIAEGLKTGRLRSDSPQLRTQELEQKTHVEVDIAPARKAESQRSSGNRKKEISVSPKMVLTGLAIIVVIVVFFVGFKLGTGNSGDQDAGANRAATGSGQNAGAGTSNQRSGRAVGLGADRQNNDTGKDVASNNKNNNKTVRTSDSSGKNVIVIQGISISRQDELRSIQGFYGKKGIETEIIEHKSGYALLVTKAGFKENPDKKNTEGNRLKLQIMRYGKQYPGVTGDTKFGTMPFQDAYPLKRD